MSLTHDRLISFALGSSIVTTFISFVYIGGAYHLSVNKKSSKIAIPPLFLALLFVSLYYGAINVLYVYLVKELEYSPNVGWGLGAVFGLLLSLLGRFILNYPILVFGFKKEKVWQIHLVAMALYSVIWGCWVRYINKWFGLTD